ncbi:MAG: hypothetical protein V3T88_09030, partial [Nitrosomonadaceae bacterium]
MNSPNSSHAILPHNQVENLPPKPSPLSFATLQRHIHLPRGKSVRGTPRKAPRSKPNPHTRRENPKKLHTRPLPLSKHATPLKAGISNVKHGGKPLVPHRGKAAPCMTPSGTSMKLDTRRRPIHVTALKCGISHMTHSRKPRVRPRGKAAPGITPSCTTVKHLPHPL